MTKCPKCQSQDFELVQEQPFGADFPLAFLKCKMCETFLDSLLSRNTNTMIDRLQNDINKIKKHLGIIDID